MVSIRRVNENPRFPTELENEFLKELVYEKTIKKAYFYNGNVSCNRGKYLLDEIESKFPNGSEGTESVKNENDEYYTYYSKDNYIFAVDYPDEDYKRDGEYWNDVINKDKQAIKLLNSI